MLAPSTIKQRNKIRPIIGPQSLFASGSDGVLYDMQKLGSLAQTVEGTEAVETVGDPVRFIADQSGNEYNAVSALPWLLRMDVFYSLQRDEGVFEVTLPALGSDVTVAFCDAESGVTVLTGQTVAAGVYALPSVSRLSAFLLIDRALTATETELLARWMLPRAPKNWLLGVGTWDDAGEWDDACFWQSVD